MKKIILLIAFCSSLLSFAGSLVIPPTLIYNGTSLTASVDSTLVHVLYSDNVGIQLVWTGTPTGQFGISGSNDATLSTTGGITGGTWTAITGTYPAPAGSASNGLIGITNYPYAFIKVTYTASSGTGTVTARLVAKPI